MTIFTSRLNGPEVSDRSAVVSAIQDWLEQQGLPRLRLTDRKLWEFKELWDDKAVAVLPDTGHPLNEPLYDPS